MRPGRVGCGGYRAGLRGTACARRAGRTLVAGGAVRFDWLGVTARLQVSGASYVSATVSSTAATRGTRLKAYTSDAGFLMYPEVQFWVRGGPGNATTSHDLVLSNRGLSATITLENIVDPQCESQRDHPISPSCRPLL